MERGSKLAILKLKLVEPKNMNPFYSATVIEYVYNKDKKVGGNWETAFYPQTYIFDTSLELEEAKFDLEIDSKNKYDFKRISNPEKSIIRVVDFKYENHTQWERDGKTPKKDNYGKNIVVPVFYLTEIAINSSSWKNEKAKIAQLEKKIEEYKEKLGPKSPLRLKIAELEKENSRLFKMLDQQTEKTDEAKLLVKQANRERMVYKRKNTIVNNQLERTQNKLQEKRVEIENVKKMKVKDVISRAEDFNFTFDDI